MRLPASSEQEYATCPQSAACMSTGMPSCHWAGEPCSWDRVPVTQSSEPSPESWRPHLGRQGEALGDGDRFTPGRMVWVPAVPLPFSASRLHVLDRAMYPLLVGGFD